MYFRIRSGGSFFHLVADFLQLWMNFVEYGGLGVLVGAKMLWMRIMTNHRLNIT